MLVRVEATLLSGDAPAASAYAYRADRPADQHPPESWILLMQFVNYLTIPTWQHNLVDLYTNILCCHVGIVK